MNKIEVYGNLTKTDKKYVPGYVYELAIRRKSGTIDTIMVISPESGLMEGSVHITGHVRSEYIHGVGVPVFIVPEMIEAGTEESGFSETVVTGTLKDVPKCRSTKSGKAVATILVITEEGTIPTLLWGGNATSTAETYKAGDRIRVTGRMQSREYPDKKGNIHTTYELSASRIEKEEQL